MKNLVFVLLMFLPVVSNAQRIDKPGEPYDAFCTVRYPPAEIPTVSIPNYRGLLYDKDGNYIKFEDLSSFFTYMSKIGWTFVKDFVRDTYLFKKQVYSDDEIKNGMFFKEDFKKKKE